MIPFLIVLSELILLFFLTSKTTNRLFNLFYAITHNKTVSLSLLSLIIYPGVVVHELSHLITAAILFVPVKSINLVPEKTDDGIRSGSVTIAPTDILRRTLVGIAPLFVGIAVLWAITAYVLPPISYFCHSRAVPADRQENGNLYDLIDSGSMPGMTVDNIFCTNSIVNSQWSIVLSVYLIFSISSTMYSSKKDLEALKIMVPVLLIIAGILYIAGFQAEWIVVGLEHMQNIFQTVSIVVAFALIVQTMVFVFTKTANTLTQP